METRTIFDHKIKMEISQSYLEHLIGLLRKDIKNCGDINHMEVYLPLLNYLEEELNKNKL